MSWSIRPVQAADFEPAGRLCVQAYQAIGHFERLGRFGPTYRTELSDVAARAAQAVVLVATEAGQLLGCVTFVPDRTSPLAEFVDAQAASFRMLAVAPAAQGRGVGAGLVDACLTRARASGRRRVIVHSTPWMPQAHHLYERLGFRRAPELDWQPEPEVPLLAFVCPLEGPGLA